MMLRYALQTVRDRKGGFLGAFLALMCAATLITACGTLLETGLRGTIQTERYAAAPVVVSADQNVHQTTVKRKKGKTKTKHKAKPIAERAWLPDEVAAKLNRAAGVDRVIPELTFMAQPLTPAGTGDRTPYGHAWDSAALTPYTLTTGTPPTAQNDVVVDRYLADRARLKPGDRLTVQSTQSPRTYRVTGIAAPAVDVRHQTSLFFSTSEARRLAAHPGRVTAFGVIPSKGTDTATLTTSVTKALHGTTAQVSAGGERGPVEFLDAATARVKLVSMGGAMGGTSLLVAVLVVVGTFALSVQQRHRELALLRAIAATPAQLRTLLGREALLVGAAAGAAGALAGLPLGHWLHGRFVAMGAVPATLQHTTSVFPVFAAIAATLLGAWAAARVSSRRITRIRPAEALAEARVERTRPAWGRILAGLALLAGGVVLVTVLSVLRTEPASTPVTFLAVVVLSTSVALLGPLLVRAAAAVLRVPLRLSGPSGRLASANLRDNAARMASVVTPLTLLIGMTCTVLFVQPTLGDAARTQAREGIRADWVLAGQGPGVPAQAARQLRTDHDVATEVVRTTVRAGLDKFAAQGVTTAGLTRTWDPDVTAGSLAKLTNDTVAVSELAADQLHLKPGSRLRLTLGDGTPVTLTVAAVYAKGLGFGDLTMAHDLVARHVDNPLAATVLVSTTRSQVELAADVRKFPGLRVLSPATADSLQAERQRANAEVNYLAMGLVLAFTAIAVVNTLAMSVSERVREFAMLRLAGATRRQVLRMLRTEALAVLLLAVTLGSGIALAVLTAFSIGMTGSAAPAIAPLLYVLVVGAAGLLALVATALPGRVALKSRAVVVATAKE
ncbi:FtsX-like permease family protein [Streptomyces montanus]|uniref:FtsX-like permease family protein n=1 Tax=Streptomyces montanus TaxID=2580423 RepID=A0A5R9G3K4_9ACTN|nr:FtsX-like permease family protein [Streptomyces montanus]TLS47463.1 FtsX-like permease family protein [Streptomyces montanus]